MRNNLKHEICPWKHTCQIIISRLIPRSYCCAMRRTVYRRPAEQSAWGSLRASISPHAEKFFIDIRRTTAAQCGHRTRIPVVSCQRRTLRAASEGHTSQVFSLSRCAAFLKKNMECNKCAHFGWWASPLRNAAVLRPDFQCTVRGEGRRSGGV